MYAPPSTVPAIVDDRYDVAVLDAAPLGLGRVQPHRVVLIPIGALDLAGLDLPQPGDVFVLGVHTPARMVGTHEQRILLGALGADGLLMADAFGDPLGHRGPLEVVREVLFETGGLELELAGRCRERVLLRILIEVVEAGGDVLPSVGRGNHIVSLLVELLPADEVGAPGGLPAVLDELGDGLAAGVFLQQSQALGDLADDLVVAERLGEGFDALVLREQKVVLAAEDVAGNVVLLKLGVDREDDIGHQAVVLQPWMLGEHEFDVGVPHRADVVVARVPAGDPRR